MKNYVILALSVALLASCAQSVTKGEQYAKIYEEKPTSILVMPPINNTNVVEAKDYFYNSIAHPMCEQGYYVVSPLLALDLLKQESAYESENFINGNLAPFKKVFGVDAALFTTINKYKKSDLANTITVEIEYLLRSTKTNEVLFDRKGTLKVNCGSNMSSGGGLLGLAVQMAANALETAATDKIVGARRCNLFVLSDMPAGPYSPKFGKDMKSPAGKKDIKGSVNK
jgi:hypothetical protein